MRQGESKGGVQERGAAAPRRTPSLSVSGLFADLDAQLELEVAQDLFDKAQFVW